MKNMLEYLEAAVNEQPDKVAFFDDREQLRYSDVQALSMRIGSCLARTAPIGTPVALLLDARSIRNITAIFGVLYAGCAYAPLDCAMPTKRLRLMLALLKPAAVVTDEHGAKALSDCGLSDVPQVLYTDAAQTDINEQMLGEIRAQATPNDPMSILYTSGSTGIPKGSVQTHASYLSWTKATIDMYHLTKETVFGNQSPFFYANSILDIFPPTALGASVYLLPAGALSFPKLLLECLNAHRVTALCMTPSSFIGVVGSGVLQKGCLPHLKWGIMSGEAMPPEPLKVWMDASPNAEWWHFYGSTEMFSVAVGKVDKSMLGDKRLPVGRPFPHTGILFADENGEAALPGVPGEMWVSSPWIAKCYHHDDDRTARAWVKDPLRSGDERVYFRGGDVGVIREDGQLTVLGRRDTQIKHRGYRMEIGETEQALRKAEGLQDGCVLFDADTDRLWCFYVGAVDEKQIKRELSGQLARYMLPDVFVRLDEMPHTATMKLDRSRLREMMK